MTLELTQLNYIDYLVFTIIIVSMVIGFFRGFIKSFLGFFAWIFAMALMFVFEPNIYEALSKHVNNKILLYSFSYFGAFILFLLIISFINSKIMNIFSGIKGGVIDLSLGAAFGVIRGCVISCVLFFLVIWLSHTIDTKPHALTQAQSFRLLKLGTNFMIDYTVKYSGHEPTEKFLTDTQEKLIHIDSEDEELKNAILEKASDTIGGKEPLSKNDTLSEPSLKGNEPALDIDE